MKKTLLMMMLASMLALAARGQALQNTYWRSYDTLDVADDYVHFAQDTMLFSNDNISYYYVAKYIDYINSCAFTNGTWWGCFGSDTGLYDYFIITDTLWFILISDSCLPEADYMTTHYFVQIITTIEDINPISNATISPNPSADGIFNLMFNENGTMPNKIYVLATDGRKILEENILSGTINHTINLQSRASGIYFLVMENENGRRVMKLVR